MRTAITYLRFSSAIQGAEGADSTRRQNDLFKQWLKKNSDAQVVAAYFHERRSLNNFHRDRVITFEQIAE